MRLKELLKERQASLYQLAMGTGKTETTLRNIRNGKTKGIDFETLYLLCRELKCTPNDLFVFPDDLKKGGRKK